MKTFLPLLLIAALLLPAVILAQDGEKADDNANEPAAAPAAEPTKPAGNPVAVITTSMGIIELELFPKAAPKTVANFLELAEGKREFTDVKTGEKVTRHFFDGLKFHRVIKGFMIQGGCPLGSGSGDPGYKFEDEINAKGLGLDKIKAFENDRPHQWLLLRSQQDFQRRILMPLCRKMGITSQEDLQKRQAEVQAGVAALTLMGAYENEGYVYNDQLEAAHPVKGVIAMANSGPATNGSQFFINLGDTPHLTGRHTVFGKVVSGMKVVEAIGEVKVGDGAIPVEEVKILTIRQKK